MFCSNCGKEIKFTDSRCPYCRCENEFFINPDDFVADFSSDDHHPTSEKNHNSPIFDDKPSMSKEEYDEQEARKKQIQATIFIAFFLALFFGMIMFIILI